MKGYNRISMIWVPPLGFDTYCGGKLLPLRNKFISRINSKKKISEVINKFWKMMKSNFLENDSNDFGG